jgi:hypothetical protein
MGSTLDRGARAAFCAPFYFGRASADIIGRIDFSTIYRFYFYIHTYHSRFIPEGVAEASRIFPPDAHVTPNKGFYFFYSICLVCITLAGSGHGMSVMEWE